MLLPFSGDLTIHTAEATRIRLLDALSSGDPVVALDCAAVDEVDLTFLQMIIAARKAAEASGRELRLASPAGGVLLDALHRSGLLVGPEGSSLPEDAFWTKGEGAA